VRSTSLMQFSRCLSPRSEYSRALPSADTHIGELRRLRHAWAAARYFCPRASNIRSLCVIFPAVNLGGPFPENPAR
jgi:hypothetical protein